MHKPGCPKIIKFFKNKIFAIFFGTQKIIITELPCHSPWDFQLTVEVWNGRDTPVNYQRKRERKREKREREREERVRERVKLPVYTSIEIL